MIYNYLATREGRIVVALFNRSRGFLKRIFWLVETITAMMAKPAAGAHLLITVANM